MRDRLLADAASAVGLRLTVAEEERLAAYADRVMDAPFDLVGYRTRADLLRKGICDCLAVFARFREAGSFVDVGSGAGLPGLVFGILGMRGLLIEARHKKSGFLADRVDEWALPLTVVEARAEEAAAGGPYREAHQLAITRAVGPLALVLELMAPFVAEGGTVAALKGPRVAEEKDAGARAAKALGLSRLNYETYAIPGLEPGGWVVVTAQKVRKCPKNYPRQGAKLGRW